MVSRGVASQQQRSAAGTWEGGFQPNIWEGLRPWFRGGFFYSSGDGNANDSVHGTFFALLPTPRVYARFPFFNEMNKRDLFGEVVLRPAKEFDGTQRYTRVVALKQA